MASSLTRFKHQISSRDANPNSNLSDSQATALSDSLGSRDSQNLVENFCFKCHQTFTFSLPCLETTSGCLRAW